MFAIFSTVLAATLLAAIPPTKGAELQVVVGGTGVLQFNPNQVTAAVGDVVTFIFKQQNHTATQSTLAQPCSPKDGGFDSGFIPVAADVTDNFPAAQFQVQDTNPVWVYCRQANHCQQGMVFAINGAANFSTFQSNAFGNSTASTSASAASSTATTPTSTTASTAATSTSSSTTDHKVIVGGTGSAVLTYQPSNITAQPGDTVTFEFHQKNHTVTQSSFAAPCQKLASTSTSGQVGFASGFMPVADNATSFPTFTIQINDTSPIWAYCAQTGHCGQGMVFSVNANESSANTFEAFQAKAIQINGTSSNSTSSGNGALSTVSFNHGAGFALAFGGVVLGLLL
ncbi:uncharacterized protein STEHIDRAFT_119318 [Stereum hirsutum FP-91666 SS1]|uniref:uncharacterized protein n=1 Tax=Stereum hirsutum (strain FP-91666) TaxID=721885 RepID=UPI000440EFC2|nr:uncharacterized protein STEHIDRAFT_119318 [Stereum hirsutum FP-91666 SS1]EIM90287.1 hypothetical protein STEHIDRAFT_119318 [Stereum hirsutum FP-91666 SS1]